MIYLYGTILLYIYTHSYTTYNDLYSNLCSCALTNTSLLHADCWICLRLLTIIWEFFGLTPPAEDSISDQSYQWRHVGRRTHANRLEGRLASTEHYIRTNQNTFQASLPFTACGLVPSQGRRMRERWG